jgi:hypothetical protein
MNALIQRKAQSQTDNLDVSVCEWSGVYGFGDKK